MIMSASLKRNLPLLRILHRSKPALVKSILKHASSDLTKAICECSLNVLKGNIKISPAQKRKLAHHKTNLRLLANKKTSLKKRKRILQKGGFIGALLGPVLGVLEGLLGVGRR